MTLTEQTDAEFLRRIVTDFKEQMVGVAQRRLRAIADRLEAESAKPGCSPSGEEPGSLPSAKSLGQDQRSTAPSLPALLTECPECTRVYAPRDGDYDVMCPNCHGTGKVLTPAGQQVSELIDWKSA